ncbi:MAG: NADH-quinone oxidoreductase subunit NuoK [Proteobacteria bacterium]|nr:NADH-quinone oxidoreductase subunit NuoK [Pseudomonadota bacterium]
MINQIPQNYFVILSALMFCIGVMGIFLNRKTIISVLMSIEIMLLAVNINFVSFSVYLQDVAGQIFSIFVLAIAGAEAAIALAILVVYFHNKGNIEIVQASSLKG